MSVRLDLELPTADAEALLRHVLEHAPDTGDFRHDAHLREAFEALASALRQDIAWVAESA